MDRAVFERMDMIEANHWWFLARRKIIGALIEPLLREHRTDEAAGRTRGKADILEAGCGSGGNLAMLSRYGAVDAFEFDDIARDAAMGKAGFDIPFGALPDQVPFADRRYDLIGLFDVLEHVEADTPSLAALAARLKDDGKLLVTVPAFPFMWSKHDEHHHHFRRYTRKSLTRAAEAAGLRVVESHYFNSLLFPLAVVTRGLKKILGRDTPDDQLPAGWVNATLTRIFSFEQKLIRRVPMPFGLSLAAVLEKA